MELIIKQYIDGANDKTFNEESPITLSSYTYTAARMSVPTLTGKFYHESALQFDGKEYVEFKGENYYFLSTPTNKKSNTSLMYEYDATFVSERNILNKVYFYDVVTDGYDKYFTDSTVFSFSGTLEEFASRLNSSMTRSDIGYQVVVDDDVTSEQFTFSFSDSFLLAAIGQAWSVAEVQFYFVGKTIHFGEPPYELTEDVVEEVNGIEQKETKPIVFEYGVENSLLEIQKANANFAIKNRATGIGSSDNLPYYYPNNSEEGSITYSLYNFDDASISYIDFTKLRQKFGLREGMKITYQVVEHVKGLSMSVDDTVKNEEGNVKRFPIDPIEDDDVETVTQVLECTAVIAAGEGISSMLVDINCNVNSLTNPYQGKVIKHTLLASGNYAPYLLYKNGERVDLDTSRQSVINNSHTFLFTPYTPLEYTLHYFVEVKCTNAGYGIDRGYYGDESNPIPNVYSVVVNANITSFQYNFDVTAWTHNDDVVKPDESGISVVGTIQEGAYIKIDNINRLKVASTLMPPIYRKTGGKEVFYNATNGLYKKDGKDVVFVNEYTPENKSELKQTYDISPTIVGMTNLNGDRIDKIVDVAFDIDDNSTRIISDDDESATYQHQYFYIRLPKMNGEFGFNIFDSALVQDGMKLSMKTGACAACNFTIQVIKGGTADNQVFYNPVKVDANGDIIVGTSDDILAQTADEVSESQQDTTKASVWIAVLKDTEYITNQIFPDKEYNIIPSNGDEFVLLNIALPQAYITYAEKKLEDEIINSLIENNEERFTFSPSISRIYLQEHPDVATQLNEYAKLSVKMDNVTYPLYVTSYSYKYSSTSLLPDVSVQLSDTIFSTTNSLEQYTAQIGESILSKVIASKDNVLEDSLRKDRDDSTDYHIGINGGLKVSNGLVADSATVNNNLEVSGNIHSSGKGVFDDSIIVGSGYSDIDGGKGSIISENTIETDYITARKGLKTQSIQINEIQAMSSEYYFSNSAEIKTVDQVIVNYNDRDNTLYKLELEIKDGHENPFVAGDILIGKKNNLFANQERKKGENASQYYNVWLKVYSVDGDYILCEQYDASLFKSEIDELNNLMDNYTIVEDESGQNVKQYPSIDVVYPPEENMVLVHRGNVDPINHKDRTNCWYRSSEDGVDVWLENVTSPILTASNYVCWFGIPKNTPTYYIVKKMYEDKAKKLYIDSLPEGTEPTYDSLGNILDDDGSIIDFSEGFGWDGDRPAVFTKTLVYQDDIRIDYEGVIHYQENYRGAWSLETAQSETEYYKATDYRHDVVYYNNAKWEYVSATDGDTKAPDETDSWRLLEAAVGVKRTAISYTESSNGTTEPTYGWASTIPYVPSGHFLWTRTAWYYTDDSIKYAYSVSKIGEKGDDGNDGKDGTDYQYVFKLDNIKYTNVYPQADTSDPVNNPEQIPIGWSDDPLSTTEDLKYQYVSKRIKIDGVWSDFSEASLWSTYSVDGKDGTDGADGTDGKDGTDYQYVFKLEHEKIVDNYAPQADTSDPVNNPEQIPVGWSDDPLSTTEYYRYQYVSKRIKVDGIWSEFSDTALWSIYSLDGTNGKDGTDGDNGISAKPREYLYYLSSTKTFDDLKLEYQGTLPSESLSNNTDNYNPSNGWESVAPSLDNGKNRWATYRDYDTTTQTWSTFVKEYIETNWAERGIQGAAIKFAGEFVSGVDYPYSDTLQVYVRIGSSYFIRKNQNAVYPTNMTGTDDSRWGTYWKTDSVTDHILATKIDAQEIDVDSLWTAFLEADKIWTKSVEIHDNNGNAIAGVNSNNYDFWSGDSTNPNFHVKDGSLYTKDGEFSGNIIGSTITGSTIKTADSGKRIEISANDNTIKVYNVYGSETVSLGEDFFDAPGSPVSGITFTNTYAASPIFASMSPNSVYCNGRGQEYNDNVIDFLNVENLGSTRIDSYNGVVVGELDYVNGSYNQVSSAITGLDNTTYTNFPAYAGFFRGNVVVTKSDLRNGSLEVHDGDLIVTKGDVNVGEYSHINLGENSQLNLGKYSDIKLGDASTINNLNIPTKVYTTSTTLTKDDCYVVVNATTTTTITLPNFGMLNNGHVFYVKNRTSNDVTVDTASGAEILDSEGNTGTDVLTGKGDVNMYVWVASLGQYMGGDMR